MTNSQHFAAVGSIYAKAKAEGDLGTYLGAQMTVLMIHEGSPLVDFCPMLKIMDVNILAALCTRCGPFKSPNVAPAPAGSGGIGSLTAGGLADAIAD